MAGVLIIGGGIIGLNCAYQLRKRGFEVSIIDEFNFDDNCSIGNMGFLSPSHFTPLASPDIVWNAIKWMMDSSSPFYIRPRLDYELIRWGFAFLKAANTTTVMQNAEELFGLLMDSSALMSDVIEGLGMPLNYVERGCLMLCQSELSLKHEILNAEKASRFGLVTQVMTGQEVQDIETEVEVNCKGAVWFKQDAHLDPAQWLAALVQYLKLNNVKFIAHQKVLGFEMERGKITKAFSDQNEYQFDSVIIANGSKMPELLQKIGVRTCKIQPGKGYSFNYDQLKSNLIHPSILVDHRAAVAPVLDHLRIGGTMEMSGHTAKIEMNRVNALFSAFALYYPSMHLKLPDPSEVWYGFRPVSFDGMPYIGAVPQFNNAFVAGGHSMLGISLASITGKIIADLIAGTNHRDLSAFSLER